METEKLIGLIIAAVSVTGGMAIGAIAVATAVPWSGREKLAKLEARNKERLAMIEKGIAPEIIFSEPKGAGQDPMLWGLLLAGMGLGILLGYLVHLLTGGDRNILTNALAILFGGVGLIIYAPFRKRSKTL